MERLGFSPSLSIFFLSIQFIFRESTWHHEEDHLVENRLNAFDSICHVPKARIAKVKERENKRNLVEEEKHYEVDEAEILKDVMVGLFSASQPYKFTNPNPFFLIANEEISTVPKTCTQYSFQTVYNTLTFFRILQQIKQREK